MFSKKLSEKSSVLRQHDSQFHSGGGAELACEFGGEGDVKAKAAKEDFGADTGL